MRRCCSATLPCCQIDKKSRISVDLSFRASKLFLFKFHISAEYVDGKPIKWASRDMNWCWLYYFLFLACVLRSFWLSTTKSTLLLLLELCFSFLIKWNCLNTKLIFKRLTESALVMSNPNCKFIRNDICHLIEMCQNKQSRNIWFSICGPKIVAFFLPFNCQTTCLSNVLR